MATSITLTYNIQESTFNSTDLSKIMFNDTKVWEKETEDVRYNMLRASDLTIKLRDMNTDDGNDETLIIPLKNTVSSPSYHVNHATIQIQWSSDYKNLTFVGTSDTYWRFLNNNSTSISSLAIGFHRVLNGEADEFDVATYCIN